MRTNKVYRYSIMAKRQRRALERTQVNNPFPPFLPKSSPNLPLVIPAPSPISYPYIVVPRFCSNVPSFHITSNCKPGNPPSKHTLATEFPPPCNPVRLLNPPPPPPLFSFSPSSPTTLRPLQPFSTTYPASLAGLKFLHKKMSTS